MADWHEDVIYPAGINNDSRFGNLLMTSKFVGVSFHSRLVSVFHVGTTKQLMLLKAELRCCSLGKRQQPAESDRPVRALWHKAVPNRDRCVSDGHEGTVFR